jgi:hypothetical protein
LGHFGGHSGGLKTTEKGKRKQYTQFLVQDKFSSSPFITERRREENEPPST